MWINFLWALIPILWLIISLGIIGMSASRACTIGLIITITDAVLMFKQPLINTLSGALEGYNGNLANYVCNFGGAFCLPDYN